MLKKSLFFVSIFFTVVIGHRLTSTWFNLSRMSISCLILSALVISIFSSMLIFKKQYTSFEGVNNSLCNGEKSQERTVVFQTHTIHADDIMVWVQKVEQLSGQPVSCHFVCGRTIICTTGDIPAVKDALIELKKDHDDMYFDTLKRQQPDLYSIEEFRNSPGKITV